MKIKKFKVIQIFSNGSIHFTFKSFKDSTNSHIFLEKDLKNFHYNVKIPKIIINNENFLNYKNKYTKNT
jgi:hypothetical protein